VNEPVDPYMGDDPREKLRRILEYLRENPYSNIREIHNACGIPVNFLSGFLAALHAAGILKAKKAGNNKLYAPTERVIQLLEQLQRQM